eukprot:jgi/Bigna1/85969/estExt_fgenesh1_pg.C_70142
MSGGMVALLERCQRTTDSPRELCVVAPCIGTMICSSTRNELQRSQEIDLQLRDDMEMTRNNSTKLLWVCPNGDIQRTLAREFVRRGKPVLRDSDVKMKQELPEDKKWINHVIWNTGPIEINKSSKYDHYFLRVDSTKSSPTMMSRLLDVEFESVILVTDISQIETTQCAEPTCASSLSSSSSSSSSSSLSSSSSSSSLSKSISLWNLICGDCKGPGTSGLAEWLNRNPFFSLFSHSSEKVSLISKELRRIPVRAAVCLNAQALREKLTKGERLGVVGWTGWQDYHKVLQEDLSQLQMMHESIFKAIGVRSPPFLSSSSSSSSSTSHTAATTATIDYSDETKLKVTFPEVAHVHRVFRTISHPSDADDIGGFRKREPSIVMTLEAGHDSEEKFWREFSPVLRMIFQRIMASRLEFADIGTFSTHECQQLGREFLVHDAYTLRRQKEEEEGSFRARRQDLSKVDPVVVVPSSSSSSSSIARQLNGEPKACFKYGIALLNEAQCENLIAYVDHEMAAKEREEQRRRNGRDDLKMNISLSSLETLIGKKSVNACLHAFGRPPSRVVLRRCAAIGKHINFHTDVSRATMQVALNEEYSGGRLVFATERGFEIPLRRAGTATIHDNRIVHGVTQLRGGIRYGLFFLEEN